MRLRLRSRIRTSLQRPPKSIRIARQADGQYKAEGLGAWYRYWRDPYHLLLTIPWWGFVGIVGIAYLLLNMIFAGLYLLGNDALAGARSGSFEDAFFFSVQTLGSIGYGVISPQTTYANAIVTLEALASLLVIAVVTGLSFARFSKPTARVVFSRHAVIAPHNGVPTLMFRMANQRGNQILEAQIRLYLLRNERTLEGESFYRVHSLDLLRDRNPGFSLSWTAMHPIVPSSPLYGATPESIVQDHAQLVVSMSGIDETVAYAVTLRHVYGAVQILFDYRLADIIETSPEGDRYLNRAQFHAVEPLESADLSQFREFMP